MNGKVRKVERRKKVESKGEEGKKEKREKGGGGSEGTDMKSFPASCTHLSVC